MKTYNVNVSWEMFGSIDVQANSEEEAIEKVKNMPRVTDGQYVSASYEVGEAEETEE